MSVNLDIGLNIILVLLIGIALIASRAVMHTAKRKENMSLFKQMRVALIVLFIIEAVLVYFLIANTR